MACLGRDIWGRLIGDLDRIVVWHVSADETDVPFTARKLIGHACAARLAYEAMNIGPRSLIGIVHRTGPALYAAWLGALWAGHIPTMVAPPSPRMDPRKYAEGFASIVNHLGIEALALDAETQMQVANLLPDLPMVDVSSVSPTDNWPIPIPRDETDVVVVQHTSGTTGLQKAIGFTSRQIANHTEMIAQSCEIDRRDVIASWLPLYHDMGFIACFVTPLMLGISIVEISPFDWVSRPAMLLNAISRQGATLCWLPNFAFNVLSGERVLNALDPGTALGHVKAFISCSEPVQADSLAQFAAVLSPFGVRREQLIASYAMAENLFLVTQNRLGHPVTKRFDRAAMTNQHTAVASPDGIALISNGVPPSSTHIEIRDQGAVLNAGGIGEIWICGDHLFAGYRKGIDPNVIDDGWFNTGDLGFIDCGELYITGRAKDLIIIRGRNYYSHDIESVVGSIGGVIPGRVAAFGVSDLAIGTEKLIVLVELVEGRKAEKPRILLEIRKLVAQQFDTTIGDVRVLPPRGLVKSTAGKVARPENRRRYLEMIESPGL